MRFNGKCANCGKTKQVTFYKGEGNLCERCRGWMKAEICSLCEHQKPVGTRDQRGLPICVSCTNKSRPKQKATICPGCNSKSILVYRDKKGRHVCHTCYDHSRKKEKCCVCGKKRHVHYRIKLGDRNLQNICLKKNSPVCHYCCQEKIIRCGHDKPLLLARRRPFKKPTT